MGRQGRATGTERVLKGGEHVVWWWCAGMDRVYRRSYRRGAGGREMRRGDGGEER